VPTRLHDAERRPSPHVAAGFEYIGPHPALVLGQLTIDLRPMLGHLALECNAVLDAVFGQTGEDSLDLVEARATAVAAHALTIA
jgi:hypothetical protein